MQIVVLKESAADEMRVALVPESVKKLVAAGNEVSVETGAGLSAGASDADYRQAGAKVSANREELPPQADVLLAVNRPADEVLAKLKTGAIVIALLRPLDEPEKLQAFIDKNLTAISLEMVPRTTRAQAMDVLSSMATIAGYKAVLLATEKLPRMFPMLTTAAGTIPPARVLVVGAGVAGLQAIATARRLGAVVEGFDIRAAAGEAVRSLGAKFLELENINAEGEGGYAKEVGADVMEKARELLTRAAANADCIITTAQVPGRRAPLLITRAAVEAMKRGSAIVDLAGANGGNCELSAPNETVNHDGVLIYAPTNLPATIPVHASQLFSRNVTALCNLLAKNGALNLDFADDILSGCCIVHQGEIRSERIRQIVSGF
ncbi:MAG TPA: Re/Si-specific NAD(P)(+) transhydrogenase subunit alpha [Pyrinomonadaceae bacterium]|nr:Re/Si-specific NAD(P)(+) transhydrogenase subunit alpha [Pyrinomonadaceae bacterium]